MKNDGKILIVEDDDEVLDLIKASITPLGLQVESSQNGKTGLALALANNYELVILDINLPALDGLEICQRLRKERVFTPIFMLTARDSEIDRVLGLEFGADDYMTKPFSVAEFRARTKALLRRANYPTGVADQEEKIITIRGLQIDLHKERATLDGEPLELTPREYDLLAFLAERPGVPFSRSQLLSEIWGYEVEAYESNVNSHVNRLRHKLEKDKANPEYLLTVRGKGYKLSDGS